MYFDHIYTPLTQLLPDPPLLFHTKSNFVLPFIKNSSKQFVLPMYSWVCDHPLVHGKPIRDHNLKKTKSPQNSYQSSVAFWLAVGLPFYLSFHMEMLSGLTLHRSCAASTIVSSRAQLPCCVWKTLSCCIQHCLLLY